MMSLSGGTNGPQGTRDETEIGWVVQWLVWKKLTGQRGGGGSPYSCCNRSAFSDHMYLQYSGIHDITSSKVPTVIH